MSTRHGSPDTELDRPYGSIVVGVDFTPCSATALRQAIRLSAAAAASLHVVHVIDTVAVEELEEALALAGEELRRDLVADAEGAWRELARTIPGAESLAFDVAINNRIAGILGRVRERGADLLVLGAVGNGAPEVGVGTVATACVRKSTSDVLLVREVQGGGGFRTVVAAIDFSPTSLRAAARAAMIAAADGAALHVLHVFDAPWNKLHYRAPTQLAPPHLQKQYRDCLERRLREFCGPVLERVSPRRTSFEVRDHAGHRSGIVEHASEIGADLIVLGTRGRTNIRDILMGSTAEKALAQSRSSVLAVKPGGFQHPLAAEAGTPATTRA